MDASATVNAGLIYGMPARPDVLIGQLQRYEAVLPVLHSLRLCHRFGKGSPISTIPVEIRLAIEDIIIQNPPRVGDEAETAFLHYENRCRLVHHFTDEELKEALDEVDVDGHMEYLESFNCDDYKNGREGCTDDQRCSYCLDGLRNSVEEWWENGDEYGKEPEGPSEPWKYCESYQMHWTQLIDQRRKGLFAKYDKLLRDEFGLQALFQWSERAHKPKAPWLETYDQEWKCSDRTTTICYLTLPKRMAPATQFVACQIEGIPIVDFGGVASSYVQLPVLDDRRRRVEQFQRVQRILGIEPFVHPSTLNATMSAMSKEKFEVPDPPAVEWPQLIMTVHASFKVKQPLLEEDDS